jgi:hypothetical protein
MHTTIDAFIALQKARNNTERMRVLKRYSSMELKVLLGIALREPPLWPYEFPAPAELAQTRIFSDLNWHDNLTRFAERLVKKELAHFEAQGQLSYMLGVSTPSQRDWTMKILSGDLGFPLTKWDVKNAMGNIPHI